MPLINRVGGGGGSKAPATGYVTPTNTGLIKIRSVENASKVKSLILYAINESSVATSRVITSVFHMFDDTQLTYEGASQAILSAPTLLTAYAYESLSVAPPSANILTITAGNDYIDIEVDVDNFYVTFDTSLKYAYILYY